MKRTFSSIKFIVVVTLLIMPLFSGMFIMSVGAQPPTTKLYIEPSKVEYWTPAFGETFTINVTIANVTNLKRFDFKLYWNTTLLDLVEIDVTNSLLPTPWYNITSEINETLGRYRLAMTSWGSANGSGRLVGLTFEIACELVGPENAISALNLTETILYDSNWNPITHDVGDGEFLYYSTPYLWITTTTDKPYYQLQDYGNITVYGNLTAGFSPVQDGLVALQVNNPRDQPFIVRTLPTGTTPATQIIEIIDMYSCNSIGDPLSNFYRGYLGYFNVTIRNNDIETHRVLIAINLYDAENTPFAVTAIEAPVDPGRTYFIPSFPIPLSASVGEARGYANAHSAWPKDGGTAYCPEKNATFTIVNGGGGGGPPIGGATGSDGNYSLTFKLPYTMAGIYRAYASASYQAQSTTSSTAFGFDVICVPDHYPTIQGAVNAASPTNSSILVLPGTYDEHVTIEPAHVPTNKSLKLVGREPSRTVIDGTGTGTVVTVTAPNVTISRFKIRNGGSSFPDSGIALKNCSISTISENIVSKNQYGINVNSSDNNFILDNTVSGNNYGIYLNRSTGNTLRGNYMVCNKYNFGVFGDSISDFTHAIDTSNTVDRKPVIYWRNKHDDEIPSNAGFVAVVSSTNITVRGIELTKNVQGVLFAFTSYSVIERVNTLNNEYGIYLAYSHYNTIIGSKVSNNSVGIHLRNSNESNIYHNNIIDNVNQVERDQSSNTWDDGGIWPCPICNSTQPKGNYWSDYTGLDDGTPTQAHNCPGDGVGDTLTPHLGVDKYPLMNPWILIHDVAITSVTYVIPYNATHVYPGWKVSVKVTVKNKGDSIENFDVTAYANTTIVQTQTVTLPVRSSTTITLTWDTTGFALGNYTVSAVADTVPSETYTTDNVLIDGTVKVALIGDVNGDRIIDIYDLVKVAIRYGSEKGKPPPPDTLPYEAIYDLNGDDIIDIFDVVIIGINYGATW